MAYSGFTSQRLSSIFSTNVAYSPNPIPAAGGTVTVSATVTDPALGLSSVVLYETYGNSTQVDSAATAFGSPIP